MATAFTMATDLANTVTFINKYKSSVNELKGMVSLDACEASRLIGAHERGIRRMVRKQKALTKSLYGAGNTGPNGYCEGDEDKI